MSCSTNAQIFYGVVFEEGFEFPWSEDDDENDFEAWYKANAEEPCPFELINVCSEGSPIYALAVKGSVKTARRGYPEQITNLDVSTIPKGADDLERFMRIFSIVPTTDFGWYLSSYWSQGW